MNFKTKTVSIFKDGTAFFVKTATVTTENGRFRMEDGVPQAKFGTLWFSDQNGELTSISSVVDSVRTQVRASSISQMLQSNQTRLAEIWLVGADSPLGPAMIERVEKDLIEFVVAGKWYSVAPGEVNRVAFFEKPSRNFEQVTSKRIISLEFKTKKPQQELSLMYLQGDLGWFPTYHVEMVADDKATITLRAVVMNDAEAFEDARINFVVGRTNFLYKAFASPLCDTNQSISEFLRDIDYCRRSGGRICHSTSGIDSGYVAVPEHVAAEDVGAIDGSEYQDFFFYTANSVKMKKGERSFINLFKSESLLKHIYEVEVNSTKEPSSADGTFHFSQDNCDKVHHTIELTNDSPEPWTTGIAMVTHSVGTAESKPVAQEMITFTPRKGTISMKLNVAPDITVQHAEQETSRTKKHVKSKEKVRDATLDTFLIKITGRIKVKNFKKKNVVLRVRRTIVGELEPTRPLCTVVTQVASNGVKSNAVSWELNLPAGTQEVIEYKYSFERKITYRLR